MRAMRSDTDDVSTDFGGTIVRRPADVVIGQGPELGRDALAVAKRDGRVLTVRGAGHSCGGQSLGEGVVLRTFMPGVTPSLEGSTVVVPACARWKDLELWLNKRGLMVPITTDYLDLSVGGTLSVGGFGFDSLIRGSQIDHVAWANVRMADGRRRLLQRGDELLRFVLTGLGRLAIIEQVAIDVIPFAPLLRVHARPHADLVSLAEAMVWLNDPGVSRPSTQLAVQYWPGGEAIERIGDEHVTPLTVETTPPPAWACAADFERVIPMRRFVESLAVQRWVETFPGHHRVWCDYGFSHAALMRFVRAVETLRPGALGSVVRAVYLAAVAAPPPGRALGAFDLRLPGERYTFTCGLYAMLPAGDRGLLDRTLGVWRELTDLVIELGGRPYLHGRYELTPEQRYRCYGADYDRFLSLKEELDPDDRFASASSYL